MTDRQAIVPIPPETISLEPGWYPTADGKTKRWFDGNRWTDHKPTPDGWYAHPTMAGTQRYFDGEQWTDHVAPGVPVAPGAVAYVGGKAYKTSHGFHLFMSIITGGIWAVFVWLPIGIYNSVKNGR